MTKKRKNDWLSGQHSSHMKIATDERPKDRNGETLPYSVAMVAECVAFYRKRLRPIRTIWLRPTHYREFEYWARQWMKEEEADSKVENYTYDGVYIKEGSELQRDDIVWDFYPTQIND